MYKKADGQTEIKLLDYLNRTTLDVIAKIAFDSDIASLQGEEDSPFIKAISKALAGFSYKINNPVKRVRV